MRKKWNIPSVSMLSSSAVKSGATSMSFRFECYQNIYSTCTLYVTPASMYYCPGYTGVVNFNGGPNSACGLSNVATEAPTGAGPFCQSIVNAGTCS